MAAKRYALALPAGVVSGVLALTACIDNLQETSALNRLRGPRLAMPTEITPPVRVQTVRGTPDQWDMNERLAAALRNRDIPASVGSASRASYVLKGRAQPAGDDGGGVKLIWELYDSNGKRVGEIEQLATMPDDSWLRVGAAALDSVAAAAADSIAPIVPSASLGDAQFASVSVPDNAPPAVDARTAIRRQMRDGRAGPLHRRLVGMAEIRGEAARQHKFTYSPDQVAQMALEADPRRVLGRFNSRARAPRPYPESSLAVETAGAFPIPAPRMKRAIKRALPPSQPRAKSPIAFNLPAMRQVPLDFTILELGRLAADEQAAKPTANFSDTVTSASSPATRATGLDYIAPQAGALPNAAYWVQIAAFRAKPVAVRWYGRIQQRNPEILEGVPHTIMRADLGRDKGVFYRVRVGPFPSNSRASGTCRSLKAAGVDCMVWKSG